MPTADRGPFVAIALESFAAQDYPERELVVVDSGLAPVRDLCAGVHRVRYVPARGGASIGAKRNLACARATGDVIVHWDDDDWYAPTRISRQVEPISAGAADVTGLENRYTWDLESDVTWTSTPALHRRMFASDVHGGTLAYRRALLGGKISYPNVNLAEDAALLRALVAAGAKLVKVPNDEIFVYVRHRGAAWRFAAGSFLDRDGWSHTPPPTAMPMATRRRLLDAARTDAPQVKAASHEGAQSIRDALGWTTLVVPSAPLDLARCVVVAASEPDAPALDLALASLDRFGDLGEVARVIVTPEGAADCRAIALRYGAAVVTVRDVRGPLQGALYSIARVVRASQYLCLDADVLVLGSLWALFEAQAGAGAGKVLATAPPATSSHPMPPHDGVFVSDFEGLVALDRLIRGDPELAARARTIPAHAGQSREVLTVVLSRLGALAPWPQGYNVQATDPRVKMTGRDGHIEPGFDGGPVRLLHLGGAGATVRRRLGALVPA